MSTFFNGKSSDDDRVTTNQMNSQFVEPSETSLSESSNRDSEIKSGTIPELLEPTTTPEVLEPTTIPEVLEPTTIPELTMPISQDLHTATKDENGQLFQDILESAHPSLASEDTQKEEQRKTDEQTHKSKDTAYDEESTTDPLLLGGEKVTQPDLNNLMCGDRLCPGNKKEIIQQLDERLKSLSQFIGNMKSMRERVLEQQNHLIKTNPDDIAYHIMLKKISEAIDPSISLPTQIQRLHTLAMSIPGRQTIELFQKLQATNLLQGGVLGYMSQLDAHTLEEKCRFIEIMDADIRQTAADLSEIQEMKDFINTSSFADILKHSDRIDRLERASIYASQRFDKIHQDTTQYIVKYNEIMTSLSDYRFRKQECLNEKTC